MRTHFNWMLSLLLIGALKSCVVFPYSSDEVLVEWKKTTNQARAKEKGKDLAGAESLYLTAQNLVKADNSLGLFQALTLRELGNLKIEQKEDAAAISALEKSDKLFQESKKKDADSYSIYTPRHFDVLYTLGKEHIKANHLEIAETYLKRASETEGPEAEKDLCRNELLKVQENLNKDSLITVPPEVSKRISKLASAAPDGSKLIADLFDENRSKLQASLKKDSPIYELGALVEYYRGKKQTELELNALVHLVAIAYGAGDFNLANALCVRGVMLSEHDSALRHFIPQFLLQKSQVQLLLDNQDESMRAWFSGKKQIENDKVLKESVDALELMTGVTPFRSRKRANQIAYDHAVELMAESPYKRDLAFLRLKLCGVLAESDGQARVKGILALVDPKVLKETDRFSYYSYLTSIYSSLEDYNRALANAKLALQYAPDNDNKLWSYLSIAEISMQRKDLKSAKENLDAAHNLKAKMPEDDVSMGQIRFLEKVESLIKSHE